MVPTKKEKEKKKRCWAEDNFRDGAELKAVGDVSGRGAGGKVAGCGAGWVAVCRGPGDRRLVAAGFRGVGVGSAL